ncbi:MAG: agmatine deiminase family protein [Saprospiraceae bacterium]|nr:agmatine deiminase family protein [Saprospiraceae bacterium]MCF8249683.1 agmatine deiminase family protein [Saprospiraceae bacterium]MCF8279842.1 agmatine deiminase family protein [Bacteroidales bacterium]MCF8312330.1 agmatine deiminase family protein [Saprospiraceae bacterium]MCF8440673.1 agmatine deiminase family protein [Saprospiraceae bacterium]
MKYLVVIAFSIICSPIFSQEEILPRGFTPEERALLEWNNFTQIPSAVGIETPPPYPVRHMAEWEELQALAIAWRAYPTILTQIVVAASQEVKVLIFCDTETIKNSADTLLQVAGANLTNVELIVVPNNSVWIRDYGPNCVYANDVEDLNFIDWVYNRPSRPKDDALPTEAGAYLNIPVYSTTLNPERMANTGGNFMSDGMGKAFASKLILNENGPGNPFNAGPHTEQDIDNIMEDYMGINQFIKMETLPYDDIHHIDMHMRLLDEETMLVGEYPSGIADGPQIEANLQYVLDNFNSGFGTPYKVVRVLQPPAANGAYPPLGDYRTYTNAVFVNKTILVPIYEPQYDSIALGIYREYYPGYKVVGINCNSMISAKGALHCITKEIGSTDPLWIVHKRLPDVENNNDLGDYQVAAQIKHRSGIASAQVYYTIDTTQAYESIAMQSAGVGDDWVASIPHQVNGSQVFYYISATANSSKTQVRPLAAPMGYYEFTVNDVISAVAETNELKMEAIYPNPAIATTVVPIFAGNTMDATLELHDVFGRNIKTIFDGRLQAGMSRHYFNASNLPPGTYLVSLKTATEISSRKVIVH